MVALRVAVVLCRNYRRDALLILPSEFERTAESMDTPTRIGLGGTAFFTVAGIAAPVVSWRVSGPVMLACATVAAWGFWPLVPKLKSRGERAPLWKAVEHVRGAINDRNSKDAYPAARTALRQAALDGHVRIFGHKSERPMGAGGNYSLVSTPIPQIYWETADIGPLATDAQFADRFDCLTFPHQMSDGRFGKEIELYAKCTVIWYEITKQWP